MIHEMKLKDIYFNKIKSGKKMYEIRLNDDKRKQIDVGDIIIFKKTSNPFEILQTKVVDLIYFDSFNEMISTLPKEKVGFEKESLSQIVDIYHQFYSEEDEGRLGVLAIKINLLNKGVYVCNN